MISSHWFAWFRSCAQVAIIVGATTGALADNDELSHVPVAAPIDTDSAGRGGNIAIQSVVRVVCQQQDSMGTGFLHKSGKIITAAHVVENCGVPILILSNGVQVPAKTIASDADGDLAIIDPSVAINAPSLSISSKSEFAIGTQVSTWGFPGGYNGMAPLLGVGYLAGVEAIKLPSGTIVRRVVVNAAFNRGNSGGPLIQIETGEVIGVVSSKLAPMSQQALQVLSALENQNSGFVYSGKKSDGSTVTFTEGQLVGMVLHELREQIQLVIGMTIPVEDLRGYLTDQKIDP